MPRYAWGWVGSLLYEARLLSPASEAAYKGYPVASRNGRALGEHPVPQDDAGRLRQWRHELDSQEDGHDPV